MDITGYDHWRTGGDIDWPSCADEDHPDQDEPPAPLTDLWDMADDERMRGDDGER